MKKDSRWQLNQTRRSSLHSNPFKQIVKELSQTIVSGFLVAVVANFLLQVFQNQFNLEVAWLFMVEWHTSLFLLGTGVLMILYIWFSSLIGNRLIAGFLLIILSMILGIITQQKMLFREEPMYPSDLSMITSLPSILKMMNGRLSVVIFTIFLVLSLGVFWFIKRNRKEKKRKIRQKQMKGLRIGLFVLSSLSLVYIYSFNHPGNIVKAAYDNHAYWIPYSQKMNYYNNGFVGGFLYNLNVKPMEKPESYTTEKVDQLLKKYTKKATEINRTRNNPLKDTNVIYVMSESFSDPTKLKGVEVSRDPMPILRERMERHKSGEVLSEGYGGGTANIEFEALTGLSMEPFAPNLSTPYTQIPSLMNDFPSAVSYFKEAGYSTTAIHPYNTSMYKRKQVYEELGFDRFLDEETMTYNKTVANNPYISDDAAYQEIVKQIKATKETDFVHLVSMQNHMPYANFYPETTFTAKGTADDSEAAHYFQGLTYSDESLDYFLTALIKQKEETIVVFWGDHLPGFYGEEVVEANGRVTMHQTPLLIFSTEKEKQESIGTISPIYFMNHVLALADSPVSPYYAFLMTLEASLPAFEKGTYLEAGKQEAKLNREELSQETNDLLKEYDLLQYDITIGNKQSKKADFFQVSKEY
ncbi:Phosphoglycerol transferase MdoB [Carnobacterium iners]|uniref:Phosphoglycerol transferase MdoB n=1 Tax=Carnobacterium iners TaxID=1073423 RepID=A0A1X7MQ37_9LACT|nr:LTA synthase family protein [Carnobacterium iners]SEL28215.1 Phosphoglycerol transferase MdoB [Carnobacterium iners]SMH26922.1 Phosphoglycerol transferase MdoB [Carnobacterium iners]